MSLLEKASIITTPTAYGVGVLNSIKPAYALGNNLLILFFLISGHGFSPQYSLGIMVSSSFLPELQPIKINRKIYDINLIFIVWI